MVDTIKMAENTMREFRERSANGAPSTVEQIRDMVRNVNDITGVMETVLKRVENGEGTLGALMTDRQLYDRLNHTAKNLEEISYKLKPIVDDARVISDKVARHPGVIVRDAVKPGVGIK
jgi:phospholipid/cholesterol/gamma-HCH transport system substrate-binding protein